MEGAGWKYRRQHDNIFIAAGTSTGGGTLEGLHEVLQDTDGAHSHGLHNVHRRDAGGVGPVAGASVRHRAHLSGHGHSELDSGPGRQGPPDVGTSKEEGSGETTEGAGHHPDRQDPREERVLTLYGPRKAVSAANHLKR